eukprot:TRINITY_DN8334_c0_g1_i1.p1 TRINITY_DN8334_c0_g1~~TRINITY_DN8334_c0_g1_i1.p1  ORF type:complete len:221 (+),score=29.24 TRINITY_DN8334_c0_g1_i1:47-664(+)
MSKSIQHLHENLVLHRDIALRNFVLSADMEPVLIDFGLARIFEHTEPIYIAQRNFLLPWRWSSPERLSRLLSEVTDDVWMFGITVWELLSGGKQPFNSLEKKVHLEMRLQDEMGTKGKEVPLDFSDKCPESLRTIIEHCCAYEPENRLKMSDMTSKIVEALSDVTCDCKRCPPNRRQLPLDHHHHHHQLVLVKIKKKIEGDKKEN